MVGAMFRRGNTGVESDLANHYPRARGGIVEQSDGVAGAKQRQKKPWNVPKRRTRWITEFQ